MITQEEIKEIRNLLEKSDNPLFLYDDDPDGLASYLLLKRKYKKGKGICVKASPTIEHKHLHWVTENSPDLVVVLDKPKMEQEFADDIKVPILWIDHHEPQDVKGVRYYNPKIHDLEDLSPTAHWAYEIAKQNLWIAATGIVEDWTYTKTLEKFKEEYEDLSKNSKKPEEWLFNSNIGKVGKIFRFALKGKNNDVKRCVYYLEKIESPYELLNQTTKEAKIIRKHTDKIQKEYDKLFNRLKKEATSSNILVFLYSTNTISFTSMLSNHVLYEYPKKDYIILGRVINGRIKLSIRGRALPLPPIIEESIAGFDGYGGGHKHACGANIPQNDFPEFLKRFKDIIKREKQ